MKLKHLESLLEDVEPFREPNVMLEQYPTGAHLAARVVHAAHERGDIEDRTVVDLGVGGGVLTIASILMGAAHVVGVDVDPGALELCRDNCDAFDPPLEPELRLARIPKDVLAWHRAAASSAGARGDAPAPPAHPAPDAPSALSTTIDENDRGSGDASGSPDASTPAALRAHTVVMNPPFGTRRKGADMQFLRAALHVADSAVYSLHKTSTRAHIEKHAMLTLRAAKAEVLAELRYELPRVYAHHRKDVVEIEVDLWRFEPPEDGVVGGDQIEYSDDSDADSDEDWGVERDGAGAGANAGAGGRRVELNYQGERNAFCDRREVEPRRAGRSGGKGARGAAMAGRGDGGRGRGRGRGGGRGGGRGRGR